MSEIVRPALVAWELTPNLERRAKIRSEGIRLTTSEWRRPSEKVMPIQCKASGFYVINAISREKARAEGFDDVLMLDVNDRITEGATSNIFMVRDSVLFTPPATYVFSGITRQTVMECAKELGLMVVEKDLRLADLSCADEVFLTGTADEITPVQSIGGASFAVGPVTQRLLRAFDAIVHQQ